MSLGDVRKSRGGMKRCLGMAMCVVASLMFTSPAVPAQSPKATIQGGENPGGPEANTHGEPATPKKAGQETAPKTQEEKIYYSIGVNMAGNLKQQGIEADLELVIKGMKDAFSGEQLLLSDAEIRKALQLYHAEVRQKQAKSRAMAAEHNGKEGSAFLAENKKKEGVISLPSGLQYRIITSGEGRKPLETDTVKCSYKGKLTDGTEFESSSHNARPATMKIAGVIPGLREALMLMPVGSKWEIFLPPQLAYAERGTGSVGPNSTLIFEVELHAIK